MFSTTWKPFSREFLRSLGKWSNRCPKRWGLPNPSSMMPSSNKLYHHNFNRDSISLRMVMARLFIFYYLFSPWNISGIDTFFT